eukprot:gene10373-biopygen1050
MWDLSGTWLLPPPHPEGPPQLDDRRLGEDGEGGGGVLVSTEWIWCQCAPRPEEPWALLQLQLLQHQLLTALPWQHHSSGCSAILRDPTRSASHVIRAHAIIRIGITDPPEAEESSGTSTSKPPAAAGIGV